MSQGFVQVKLAVGLQHGFASALGSKAEEGQGGVAIMDQIATAESIPLEDIEVGAAWFWMTSLARLPGIPRIGEIMIFGDFDPALVTNVLWEVEDGEWQVEVSLHLDVTPWGSIAKVRDEFLAHGWVAEGV